MVPKYVLFIYEDDFMFYMLLVLNVLKTTGSIRKGKYYFKFCIFRKYFRIVLNKVFKENIVTLFFIKI